MNNRVKNIMNKYNTLSNELRSEVKKAISESNKLRREIVELNKEIQNMNEYLVSKFVYKKPLRLGPGRHIITKNGVKKNISVNNKNV